jgi:hypothetical protein
MAINKNFVVKNGFEVNQDLVLANATTKKVGIGTSNPRYNLDVRGGIGATDVIVSGIATVLNELRVGTGGTIFSVIAGPTGIAQSVGVGTAKPGYLLDIRSPVSTGQTALYVQGDVRITGDLSLDDLTFDQADIARLNVSGISTFVGFATFRDSVTIEDNLYVSGITTVAANGGITTTGGDFYVGGNFYSNGGVIVDTDLYIIGIATIATLNVLGLSTIRDLYVAGFSTFVGLSTFNDYVVIQDGLRVTGVSTFVGFSTFNDYVVIQDGLRVTGVSTFVGFSTFNDYVDIQNGLRVTGVSTFAGITTVTGPTLFSKQLDVSGVSTFAGITTVTGPTLFSKQLDVSGVSTFAGITTVTGPTLFSKQLDVSGVSTLGTVQFSSGIITAASGIVTYYGDGSNLTGNARNFTATIGIGTSGGVVGYGVSFFDLRGPGLSTVYYNNSVGIATIFFQGGGSSGGSASIGIGTTPGEAFTGIITAGNLWYNSNIGRLFIYYEDVNSSQWVDASPFNVGVVTVSSADTATNVIGGIGSITQLSVSGVATFSSTVTATNFVGGGATFTNLTVNGTQTIINTTSLEISDKNIGIGSTSSPTDTLADGAGITIYGTTNKTLTWDNANSRMAFSTNVYAPKYYGDGSNLQGVVSGIALSESGASRGSSITTINFSGATVTTASGGISTVTIASAGLGTEALTASGITTTLNLSKQDHKVTATGITTITVSGGTEGDSHTVRIVNSGIATVGFSTYFLFPSGSPPSLPTASGAISLISFTVHRVGTAGTQLLAGASLNFS